MTVPFELPHALLTLGTYQLHEGPQTQTARNAVRVIGWVCAGEFVGEIRYVPIEMSIFRFGW